MSAIDDLNRRMNGFQNQRDQIKRDLDKLRRRKSDVASIARSLAQVCNGSFGGINTHITKIAENAIPAIVGLKSAGIIAGQASSDKEKGSDSDARVSSALSELNSEMRRIDSKISSLEAELETVNARIRSTRSDISDERKRMAEEALNNIFS